ncbi:MAG TPA: HAD-IA family hydrolase [Thiolinea sp.]|nr:HAD-IA family hydrolase [Thiolinea sp.]
MKQKPYQLLIFDWDGTLIDSAAHIVHCIHLVNANVGLEPRTDAEIRNIIGLGLEEAFQYLYPQAKAAQIQAAAHEYKQQFFLHNRKPSEFFAGARETVELLADQGYWLAIATGKSRQGLNEVLAETQLKPFFPVTRCADETLSKPHPLMLEEILSEYDLPVQAALMIGDTEYDLEMAHQLGMHAAGVSYGVHGKERLLALQPRVCLDDIRELPIWLASL